jgi:hypothetical protein
LDSHTHSLSNISLRWMVRECAMANTTIVWNEKRLRQLRIDISPERLRVSQAITTSAPIIHQLPNAPSYEELFAPQLTQFEDRDELVDAMSDVRDSLKFKMVWPTWLACLLWWLLELFPMKQWTQDAQGQVRLHYLSLGRELAHCPPIWIQWQGSHRSVTIPLHT